MPKITFAFFDAGGGHRSALNALRAVIEQQQRPWEIDALNLQELLDTVDPFLKLTKLRLQDFYNGMIERGWTLGTPQLLPALHGMIRLYHPAVVRLLEKHWRERRPDMVVSVIPNFNRALAECEEGPARCALCDHPHGPGRLPATLLDGARIAVSDLRQRSCA